ncbi:hypothetical protein ACOMHN_015334 [Nucella lapillus]
MGRSLEQLVEEVGSCGCFQILLIPLTYVPVMLVVWSMAFMVFGGVEPDWWCVPRDPVANQSDGSFLNYTVGRVHVSSVNNSVYSSDANNTGSFPHVNNNVSYLDVNNTVSFLDINNTVSLSKEKEYGVFVDLNNTRVLSSAQSCEALRRNEKACERIVFAPGMTTMVTEFQLVCDRSWIPSLTISLEMAGVTIGSVVGGQLGDSAGRKTTFVSFIALHATFNLIAAFSVSWQMFMVMRTLIGITVGSVVVTGFSYPTEFIGVNRRAVVNSVPYWGAACTLFSLLVWVVPHWSRLNLITAGCSALSLSGWLYLPESVRWLAVSGHMTKAHRVLCKMAKCNGRKPPSLSAVEALCSDTTGKRQRKYNYIHIFSTCKMLKLSTLFGYMWFASSVAYYGILFGIKNLSGNFNLNFFLMTLVEMPPQLFVFHLTGWFGRRWTIFGSLSICTLSMIAVVPLTLLLAEDAAGSYINAMCMVCRASLVLAWNALALFNAEHYPTVVRNIGIGFCNMCGRMGGILAPYVLHVNEPYVFYSITGAAMALTALAPLMLEETRGKPLQDELFISANQKTAGAAETVERNGQEMCKLSDESEV